MSGITKSVAVAAAGTMIEYYDYSIFSLFLPFWAPVFFSANSKYAVLTMGFYAVLISSIARPLGGIFFGNIGDRYGRKAALLFSIYGIAIATLLIGLMPGFSQIGKAAAIIIVLIRAFQMFCYGGEYNGAGIYVVELAKEHQIGLVGALLSSMALFGSVLASLVGLFLTTLNKSAPNWRLAFIFGGISGLIAIFMRRGMTESLSLESTTKRYPLGYIFRAYPREFISGIVIGGVITLPFTTVTVFINPILMAKGIFNSFDLMLIQFILSCVAVISLLVSGLLADRYSSRRVILVGTICLLLFSYPFIIMVDSNHFGIILTAEIILIILNEVILGPSNAFFKVVFPPYIRYRGVAFSFCLGMSIIGGLTPVIENYFYHLTNGFSGVAAWILLVASLTWLSISRVKHGNIG